MFFLWVVFVFLPNYVLFGSIDPIDSAAQYYFSHHDYKKALELWQESYRRNPLSFPSVLKLAELQVLLEGRGVARNTLLTHLSKYAQELEPARQKEIRTKLTSILSSFLIDEAQSAYLQANIKMQYQDWSGANSLLIQASNLEKDNISILKDRAKCELSLALYEKHYLSLKNMAELLPFDLEISTELIEAHYFHKNLKEVISLFRSIPDFGSSLKQRTLYALALIDMGEAAESVNILKSMVYQQKEYPKKQTALTPIVWYALGKSQLSHSESASEGIANLRHFVTEVSLSNSLQNKNWDPLRLSEKVIDAHQILEKHKTLR